MPQPKQPARSGCGCTGSCFLSISRTTGPDPAGWAARRAARHLYTVSGGDEPPFDLRKHLPQLPVRTVVICGRHDFICGPRWAGELHCLIADSHLVVLEHSGHFGHSRNPNASWQAWWHSHHPGQQRPTVLSSSWVRHTHENVAFLPGLESTKLLARRPVRRPTAGRDRTGSAK